MLDESKIQINKDSIKDKKKYILSYKISTLRELSQ